MQIALGDVDHIHEVNINTTVREVTGCKNTCNSRQMTLGCVQRYEHETLTCALHTL